MTRFARAKGSKASNEKAPEDSTPWEVMKEQLMKAKKETDESKKRQEAEQQRIENYENFLKEHKVQKRKATWCDFPEAEANSKPVTNGVQPKKKKNNSGTSEASVINENTNSEEQTEQTISKKKKKKNKQKAVNATEQTKTVAQDANESAVNGDVIKENGSTDTTPKKKKKKNKQKPAASESATETEKNDSSQVENNDTSQTENKGKKKKKKNKKNKNINPDAGNDSVNANDSQIETKNKQSKEKDVKDVNKQNKIKGLKKKKEKLVDGQPVRRKTVNDRSFQLILNGKEIELTRYDGFPIMKRDAERLEELKNNMIKKGIPKSEVQRTMKLERRRAEKALARMKRDVCYNCRKGGHNLSDCPELKSKIPGVDAPEGVCFKCGSTEHRQFECKVQRDKEFRFATCFICKEPGHIARQCPDNPKGLYPNGGSCKLCGDVTHLRKDCPTINDKKESTSIKLQTLDNADNLEGIGDQSAVTQMFNQETNKKPKKIKF